MACLLWVSEEWLFKQRVKRVDKSRKMWRKQTVPVSFHLQARKQNELALKPMIPGANPAWPFNHDTGFCNKASALVSKNLLSAIHCLPPRITRERSVTVKHGNLANRLIIALPLRRNTAETW
jgi:hypothetical protein